MFIWWFGYLWSCVIVWNKAGFSLGFSEPHPGYKINNATAGNLQGKNVEMLNCWRAMFIWWFGYSCSWRIVGYKITRLKDAKIQPNTQIHALTIHYQNWNVEMLKCWNVEMLNCWRAVFIWWFGYLWSCVIVWNKAGFSLGFSEPHPGYKINNATAGNLQRKKCWIVESWKVERISWFGYSCICWLFFLLPTSYFLLPTSYFLLPTSYCLLPTAYCPLPTGWIQATSISPSL
jgi:hypothetical protein